MEHFGSKFCVITEKFETISPELSEGDLWYSTRVCLPVQTEKDTAENMQKISFMQKRDVDPVKCKLLLTESVESKRTSDFADFRCSAVPEVQQLSTSSFYTAHSGDSHSSSDVAPQSISSDNDENHHSHSTGKLDSNFPGYKGPIPKWQHSCYQFLANPPKNKFPKIEWLFKVIIVGDPTVGKTTFVQRYVNNIFRANYRGTVGVDFALKVLWKSDAEVIKLQLWDIAGQERFTWITRAYYRDAHGCIVMFDLTSNASFINAMKWKKDVDAKCQLPVGSLIPAILIGNKSDLPHRAVNQEQVELVYNAHNYIGWSEVSAKHNYMVNDCMKFLVDAMLKGSSGDSSPKEIAPKDFHFNGTSVSNAERRRKCC